MWIKREMVIYLSWLVMAVILTAVFYGYSLPAAPLIYAAGLTLFVFLLISLLRYFMWHQRTQRLKEQTNAIMVNQAILPTPSDSAEKEYQNIINLLHGEVKKINYEHDRNLAEMKDYYSVWAHQIKTPIAALRLILQTEQLPQYEEIGEQLSRIEEYVEMVLGFIRSEGISGDLLLKRYSLDPIIKNAIKRHAKTFIRKKINLFYEPLNVYAVTDEKWLTFVLEQILSNALKYTAAGQISIYMDPDEPDALVIADEGIGIDACDLPRIFEKGFTGYNGREQKKATGIGLYLCHKILTKLSHTIVIESEAGVGTRVKIGFYQGNENWE